jgi:hypothetical protein
MFKFYVVTKINYNKIYNILKNQIRLNIKKINDNNKKE